MIIYGTRSSKGKAVLSDIECPHCNTKGQMVFQSAIRYFHVFWIPFFPFKKVAVGQCQHCKKVYDKKSLEPSVFAKIQEVQQKQKYSVFQFTGLLIIAAIAIWVNIPESEKAKQERQQRLVQEQKVFEDQLNNPQVNDIYYVNAGDTAIKGKNYRKSYILKVINTQPDSIDLKLSALLKLDRKLIGNSYASKGLTDDYFTSENVYSGFIRKSKNEIAQKLMFDGLRIYKVDRD